MPPVIPTSTQRSSPAPTHGREVREQPLTVGASGDDVRFVQQCLLHAGVRLEGGVDGEFGPGTRKAVRAFQEREGLRASGVVDEPTRSALERTIRRAEAVDVTPATAPQHASAEAVEQTRRRRRNDDEVARSAVERGPATHEAPAARPRSGLGGWLRSLGAGAAARPERADPAVSVRTPRDQTARAAELEGHVRSAGGQWRSGVNELNVVGLRGQDIDGNRHGNSFNRWNDTIAFVWKDSAGQLNVREFRATTDPGVGRSGSGLGVDANGDGRRDVAHMRPGQYTYRNGQHRGMSGAARPDGVMVSRDVDGDGQISRSEAQRQMRAGALNLHWAWDNEEQYGGKMLTDEVNSSSEGCQVIAMSRGDFLQHVSPLLALNARRDFRYTLVDRTER